MPSTVLGFRDAEVNQIDEVQVCLELTFQWGRQTINRGLTGRKARGPQAAGGNRLQVADFFPSLLMTPGSAKTNFFFPFLKPWADNGSTNQYSCQLFYDGG